MFMSFNSKASVATGATPVADAEAETNAATIVDRKIPPAVTAADRPDTAGAAVVLAVWLGIVEAVDPMAEDAKLHSQERKSGRSFKVSRRHTMAQSP